ncbi:T9SS type A sorting domain-containing protein [Chryseobacterium luquanense]|uniref:T9SS type A sorting domain-containing protein n=1 Tax=Chryseobacterium luquanense TaxID=2983766 RepID=A0ABT3Y097_9FLAO|nr:T9SS type A sorting domain-containing protein [Chryseobacterium luquanense]MCX8531529.1 T9SS type A sorting domain-containing protein [Chryseobacterium luquanense]
MNLKLQKLSKMLMAFLMALFSVWGWGQTVTLPHTRTTWDSSPTGWTDSPIKTYLTTFACSGSNGARFDATGDSKIVRLDSTPDKLSFVVKSNATTSSSLLVQESSDGTNYTTVVNLIGTADLPTSCTVKGDYQLDSTTRYVKWTFTRGNQNMTMDDVSITKLTSPTLSASGSFIDFTYVEGNGPSINQSVSVSGVNLNVNGVTVSASSNFEVSLDGTSYAPSQILSYSNGTFTNQNVYARLISGLTAGTYSGSITISGGGATNVVKAVAGQVAFPVSAVSNNAAFGTVSVSNNIITAIPAAGYTYATPAYSIISGAAAVSQNGNQFTVTPSAVTQVQINFEAKPNFTLSLINNTVAYSNSNFPFITYEGNTISLPTLPSCGNLIFAGWGTNANTTSAPQYLGGSTYTTTAANVTLYAVYQLTTGTPAVTYSYGFEDADTGWTSGATKSSTEAKTGSFSGRINSNTVPTQFNNLVSSPTSISFSFLRTSTNTNTNIQVEVSTNSTNWTTVATYPMNEFINGTWTEKTTSLSAYQNVYVRLLYNGTTAVRYLDDIKLVSGGFTTTYTTTTPCGANATIWDGTVWSNGTPSSTLDAYISSNYTGNGFTAQSMTVNQSTTLTINSGQTFTTGNMTNNGNIIVNDGGNFVQTVGGTYTAGTGASFVANRNSASPATKYVFWSSPITDENLYTAYSNGSSATPPTYVMTYDTATNLYPNVTNADTSFTGNAGKGYSVKVPATNASVSFGGSAKIPNNGNVNVALSTASFGYNLIGNPYPSNINLTAFYNANSTLIAPTMWLWDNTTGNVTTQTGNTAVNVGYATFNGPSGTWTEAPNTTGYNSTALNGIGAFAKIGQGFIVKAISAGSATFTNAIRASNTAVTLNKNLNTIAGKFWVKLTTSYGNNVTQAITYSQGASDAYDVYDSKAMGMGSDAFYSLAGTEKLVIQGRAPFNVNDVVQLGNKHFETGNFTISLSHKEGLFTNGQEIYLHDKQSGTYTNLQNGTYNFSASAGDFTDRFEIVYKLNVLSTNEAEKGAFEVYRDGEDFVVRNHKNIQSVEVFDAAGRKIQQITANSKSVTVKVQAKGMYILKAVSEGKEYTQKIIK